MFSVWRSISSSLILGVIASAAAADDAPDLKPLMAVPAKVTYRSDFGKQQMLDKKEWQARQGTVWKIEEGVLRGRPSSAEFQAAKKDHKGFEPRVAALNTPREFIIKMSVRFKDGNETNVVPFVEFGHHKVRIRFTGEGLTLLGDHESIKLAHTAQIKYKPGQWYHLMAELKGDEFVAQFAGGPTLYAKHPSLSAPVTSGADGLGVAGPKGGVVEIDNVAIWSIGTDTQKTWDKTRAALPMLKPEVIKAKKDKS